MYDIINLSYHNYYMEQKNENKFLLLKNYSNFLVDLGLNISFSQKHDLEINTGKIDKLKSIKDVDNYVNEWQIKNKFQLILRNNNMFSKNILLLSEENNFLNFNEFKKNQPELLEKMFFSIGQDVEDFFIINIDLVKIKENHLIKINEILTLYLTILNPKILIDMCSDDLNNFFEIYNHNLNFDYFKIPSVSHIIKNKSLKRDAWSQLKLLKVKLNEF